MRLLKYICWPFFFFIFKNATIATKATKAGPKPVWFSVSRCEETIIQDTSISWCHVVKTNYHLLLSRAAINWHGIYRLYMKQGNVYMSQQTILFLLFSTWVNLKELGKNDWVTEHFSDGKLMEQAPAKPNHRKNPLETRIWSDHQW